MLSIEFLQLQQERQGLARKTAVIEVVRQNDWRTAVSILTQMFGYDVQTALSEIHTDKDGGYYKAVIKHRTAAIKKIEQKLLCTKAKQMHCKVAV